MRAQDLLPGERVLVTARRHWILLLRPFATTILGAAVLLVAAGLLPLNPDVRLVAMLGILVAALIFLNLSYWRWHAHEYVLTDRRVLLNEGIISTVSRSIPIDRIQDVTVYQGLWGRTWGFGHLELETAGREGSEWLRTVPHPQQLRNAISAQMDARGSRSP